MFAEWTLTLWFGVGQPTPERLRDPIGFTGSVKEIIRPGFLDWRAARTVFRRWLAPGSLEVRASMSKSSQVK